MLLPCYSGPTSRRMRGSRCQLARHWESTVNLPLNMAQNTKSWHIGTFQRGISRLQVAHTAHRGPLNSRVLALPLRRVRLSRKSEPRRSQVQSHRAAQQQGRPFSAPCTGGADHTRAGGGNRHPARGPASTSRDASGPGWPNGGRHLRRSLSLRLLCCIEHRHFQALVPAPGRSVLSRELRRKGPVRCESRRGLATSET